MALFRGLLRPIISNEFYINAFKKSAQKLHTETPLLSASYDPDGKTVVNILNNEKDAPLMINTYSMLGFRLNNGVFIVGPVALFPNTILSWNVEDDHDINERSLSLFLHLSPKLDVLLIGVSDGTNQKLLMDIRRCVYDIMMSKRGTKINIEVLPTEKAVTTFNFLNVENRFVGAALIPPTRYTLTSDDEYRLEYLTKKKSDMLGIEEW